MNKERLLKLADALEEERETLPRFNILTWGAQDGRHPCGTQGCIAGTAVALFAPKEWLRLVHQFTPGVNIASRACELLDLNSRESTDLFMGWSAEERVTPKGAAHVIRDFVETGTVSWPHAERL